MVMQGACAVVEHVSAPLRVLSHDRASKNASKFKLALERDTILETVHFIDHIRHMLYY